MNFVNIHTIRIQRLFITRKRHWFTEQYSHHRLIVEELDKANSIHVFRQFEEEGRVECFLSHSRPVDLEHNALQGL